MGSNWINYTQYLNVASLVVMFGVESYAAEASFCSGYNF